MVCISYLEEDQNCIFWGITADYGDSKIMFNRRVMGELICDIINDDFTYTFFISEREEFWGQVFGSDGYALEEQKKQKWTLFIIGWRRILLFIKIKTMP